MVWGLSHEEAKQGIRDFIEEFPDKTIGEMMEETDVDFATLLEVLGAE